jgi:hypothetical protein
MGPFAAGVVPACQQAEEAPAAFCLRSCHRCCWNACTPWKGDIGPAAAATATVTAAASHKTQQQHALSSHPCSQLSTSPHSAAAAARRCVGAGDGPLGSRTPPRTPDSAKPPGCRGQGRRSITEPSMGGGIDSSGKLTAQTIVSELEVMFG